MKRLFIAIFALTIPLWATGSFAQNDSPFGVLFDIQGDATLTGADGKVLQLERSKHILKPVKRGSKISVSGTGKVLIVSLATKKGYEVVSDSEARVEESAIVATKGKVLEKSGLTPPPSADSGGAIGAMVLRNASMRSRCISTLEPSRTSVATLTPTLKWQNTCEGQDTVNVKVLNGRNIIFEKKHRGTAMTVPEGVLGFGNSYRWIVDGEPKAEIVGSSFSIVSEEVFNRLKSTVDRDDISEYLSYVFFLKGNNLMSEFQAEMKIIKSRFPDNENLAAFE